MHFDVRPDPCPSLYSFDNIITCVGAEYPENDWKDRERSKQRDSVTTEHR